MDIMSINTSSEIIGNTSLEGRHYHMRATGGGTLFIPEFGTLYQSHRQSFVNSATIVSILPFCGL